MNEIHARIHVSTDHRISGTAPLDVPPGEHEVTISVQPQAPRRFRLTDLPRHDVPWDGSVSLHREDMYGDDGR